MKRCHFQFQIVAILWLAFCQQAAATDPMPKLTIIPAGPYVQGSDRAEREAAYQLDESAYGHRVTREREWYESEFPRRTRDLPGYAITTTLITNETYAVFVQETGHPAPNVDRQTWKSYGLIHPWPRTRRHAWQQEKIPPGRSRHPVVLVSYDDATAYARWLSEKTGETWRLPTEEEWEKAARGDQGWWFPWGDKSVPGNLNSHDLGPFDTIPVGSKPNGKSSYGLLDAAGQVFEWTSTAAGKRRYIVKGGSWDDKGCGICRPAARHSRPAALKHILIGFRLVQELPRNGTTN